MRNLLFLFLFSALVFSLVANEKETPANLLFDFTAKQNDFAVKQNLQYKTSADFDMTRRLINYNRCNMTGIFLLSYSIPTFLWSVASSSVFSELNGKNSPNAGDWGAVSLVSGLLCSGLICSGLILLIFGAVKYHRYKKWGDPATLYDVFSARQRLFSYLAIGGGIATGVGTASLVGGCVAMLFYPQVISSYAFCGFLIASATVLTASLPLMIVCLSLRSWLKRECRRLSMSIVESDNEEFGLSVSIPIETSPARR